MSDGADVYRQGERVGNLIRTARGSVFEYEDSFYREHSGEPGGIAVHLPYSRKRTETFGVNLHTYFAGLLPEGLRLKTLVRNTKTSEDDLLSLLIAAGTDCIGDISVVASGQPLATPAPTVDVTNLDDVVFSELFLKSVAEEGKTAESSIPGVQEKISASTISFPLKAEKEGHAYILKLNPSDKPLLVENEEFFLRMAKACDLEVPVTRLVRDKTGASGLLVERFDRMPGKSKPGLIGIHQEDACQFLDRYPSDKYRISCSEIAEGLSVCSAPVIEVARLIRLVAFSYLIGNGDLHAKNVSIRVSPSNGRIEVTPAYDLLSTLPYGDPKMALKLDGRDNNLNRAQLIDFGIRYGVRPSACRAVLDELIESSEPWIVRTEEIGLPEKKLQQLRNLMSKRRGDLS